VIKGKKNKQNMLNEFERLRTTFLKLAEVKIPDYGVGVLTEWLGEFEEDNEPYVTGAEGLYATSNQTNLKFEFWLLENVLQTIKIDFSCLKANSQKHYSELLKRSLTECRLSSLFNYVHNLGSEVSVKPDGISSSFGIEFTNKGLTILYQLNSDDCLILNSVYIYPLIN
jgi:hypothetical protein